MARRKRGGWFGEPRRHSLASRGFKTAEKRAQRRLPRPKRWSRSIDVHEGALQGWSKDLPQEKRIEILKRVIRKDGYATVIRRLNFLINVGKDRETDRKAKADMEVLQKLYD
jgi:hypothetical protein